MSPDAEGAEDAMSYLCAISPKSAAFGKAEELAAVIGDKVSSDKGREWKQRLKEYNDEKNCAAANSPIATSVQWRQSPLAAR